MAGTIYTGSYSTTIDLVNPSSTVAASGAISVTNQYAIYGGTGTVWSVSNYGTIQTSGTSSDGVDLLGGGSVTNGSTASINALISTQFTGIDLYSPGVVTNFGTIESAEAFGVLLFNGGDVVNGSSASTTAEISGLTGVDLGKIGTVTNFGIITAPTEGGAGVSGIFGSVINLGTIEGLGPIFGAGISLATGGGVTNGSSTSTNALILGGGNYGVEGAGTLTNYGTIEGAGTLGDGAYLKAGGTLTNGSSASTTALIIGAGREGVFLGGPGTVVNYGTIESNATVVTTGVAGNLLADFAVFFTGGGSLTNGAPGSTMALITSSEGGVYLGGIRGTHSGASGTMTNFGTIETTGTGTLAVDAVVLGSGGSILNYGLIETAGGIAIQADAGSTATITNYGRIVGFGTRSRGLYLRSGGSVTNGSSTSTAALILGAGSSGLVLGAAGSVTSYGTIQSNATIITTGTAGNSLFSFAVILVDGGTMTNGGSGATQALIESSEGGVCAGDDNGVANGSIGNLLNFGTIETTGTGALAVTAVDLSSGGSVGNHGLIESAGGDVIFTGSGGIAGTVTNFGTIEDTGTSGIAIYLQVGGTVTNYGLIKGVRTPSTSSSGGVIITHGGYATITNLGTITTTNIGDGINLDHGGSIVNGNADSTAALITGSLGGIYAGGHSGSAYGSRAATSITNYGTIQSTGTGSAIRLVSAGTLVNFGIVAGGASNGIYLDAGGTVSNYGQISNTATAHADVSFHQVVGAVANLGTIQGAGNNAVYLEDGGTVSNGVGGQISGGDEGVDIVTGAGSISNFGTIISTGTFNSGVFLGGGGNVTNGATNAGAALIDGYWVGVDFKTVIGTVANFGTIESTATISQPGSLNGVSGTLVGVGVILQQGGTVTNGSTASTAALITGYALGVYIGGGSGIPNAGASGTLTNFGTILSTGTNGVASPAVELSSGGTIVNYGLINSAGKNAIVLKGSAATINNYGIISNQSNAHAAIYIAAGGNVTNGSSTRTSAVIDGAARTGLAIENAAATVVNYGTIESGAPASGTAGVAVYLQVGGTITNEKSGLIFADRNGVTLGGTVATSGNATLSNSGLLAGNIGIVVSTLNSGSNTIVNYGTITGTDGTAIQLAGTASTLVIEQNSALNGGLAGFVAGDTIDFAHQSGTSVSFSYGVLSLMAGGAPIASVDLSGLYAAGEFAVASDGSGGTDVTFSADPSQAQLTTTSDFNGDGMSDVLWQNDNAEDSGSGQTAIWLMDGVNPTAEDIITTVPTSWHVIGTGDFYGTGDADILWQNDGGQAAIWEMNGTNPTAETVFASPPPSWHMIATGDFNGDGLSDVLWQYEDTTNSSDSQNGNVAIWEMNGASPIAAAVVAQPGPDWDVIGTGDFNGDGKSDILWQYEDTANSSDPQNGNVAIWEMNGLTPIASAVIAQPGPDWHVVGTGDFNGDGKADILWQYEDAANSSDPQNGNVAIWEMNGLTPIASAVVAQPGSAWHAIGTGDYDGSGRSDILWQNTDGQAAIWLMNGLTPTTESVFAAPPSSWHVIPS